MRKQWIAGGLLFLSLFMLLGYFQSDNSASLPATIIALLIAVGLPAGGGLWLLWSARQEGRQFLLQKEKLRRQTLQAEVLRLATEHEGRLTVVEVVKALAIPAAVAEEALTELVVQGLADLQSTDSGLLVYTFRDIELLTEKKNTRSLLNG